MIDPSELNKLYPNVSWRTDDIGPRLRKRTQDERTKLSIKAILYIAALSMLPIVLFAIVMNFYSSLQVDASNVMYMLPAMILPIVFWAAVLTMSLVGITRKLDNVDVSKFAYLAAYALCGLSVAQILYRMLGSGSLANMAAFAAMVLVSSTLFAYWTYYLMSDGRLPGFVRSLLMLATILACLLGLVS